MYDKYLQQSESMLKPFTEIMSINLEAMDAIREKQLELLNDVMKESLQHASDINGQSTIESFVSANKSYWDTMQSKFSENANEAIALLKASQEKISEKVQQTSAWSEMPFWSDILQAGQQSVQGKKAVVKKSPAKRKVKAAAQEAKPASAEAVEE
ncbi:Phasin protein [Alteromonadaceae bacterium Bs31]|nr:Phasin protein [Alteromonadaceae bacterium Bs31]